MFLSKPLYLKVELVQLFTVRPPFYKRTEFFVSSCANFVIVSTVKTGVLTVF